MSKVYKYYIRTKRQIKSRGVKNIIVRGSNFKDSLPIEGTKYKKHFEY